MKRICHYAIATHLGGGERSLLELARGQREHPELGYEPWVVLPKGDGPLVDELKRAGVPYDVLRLPESALSMSRSAPVEALRAALWAGPGMSIYFPRLLALLLRRRPALIHTNALKCHVLGTLAGELVRKPVLWHLRDILEPGPVLTSLRALRRLPGVHLVGNSKATLDAFGNAFGAASGRVVYNGLRSSEYAQARNRDFNRELKLPESAPIIGILGVLARWKGQVEFLRMASELIGAGVAAGFVIVGDRFYDTRGDREYRDELQKLVDHLGLRSRVHFAGFRKDVARVLGGIDVLVHASVRPEPFGRVVVEAMACGVPVVATRSGGIPEIVDADKTGLLVDPGDVRGLAAAVRKLLADPGLAQNLAHEARARFEARFTSERYLRGVADVYDAVLST